MKAPLYNSAGEKIGEIELKEEIFGREPKKHVIWEVVKMYLANRRQGTHKAKTRAEIVGSNRKIYPQKGLGRARHGSRKAPIFVGGGKAHGPRPRDYYYEVPKKVKRLALSYALSDRAREGRILVFEEFSFEKPKTKDMVTLLEKIGISGKNAVFLSGEYNRNLYLCGRNIPKIDVKLAQDVNTYDVVRAEYVVIDKAGIEKIEERLGK